MKPRIRLHPTRIYPAEPPFTSTNVRDVMQPTHTPDGKFAPGNKLGRGNPFAARVARWRSALFSAITDDDVTAVVQALVRKARKGDLAACKVFLDRTMGRVQEDVLERFLNALRSTYEPDPDERYL